MAVRIEDAGFEIRDQIMWIYGSGFPKSHNIGKAVDKIQGNEREVVGIDEDFIRRNPNNTGVNRLVTDANGVNKDNRKKQAVKNENAGVITKGNSDWEGWGTALKPAHEPIVMARKPFKGTVADNILEYGVGGINIDGCRVGNERVSTHSNGSGNTGDKGIYSSFGNQQGSEEREGRFPANVIMDEEAGKLLDQQSGTTKSSKRGAHNNKKTEHTNTYTPPNALYSDDNTYGDEGGASRFFYCPKASKKDRDEGMPEGVPQFTGRPRREDGSVIYKETHPDEWAEAMAKKDRKDKTALAGAEEKLQELNGPKQIKGRDAGQDSRSVAHKARPTARMNIHPTVKPTELMAYLIRLVTPKGGVVLDPFMGSGSTGKAAVLEGMDFIGIEREEEYYEIAKQRIDFETNKRKFW
jgi:site-specific DNA-methyltransferase (adenine-specific)